MILNVGCSLFYLIAFCNLCCVLHFRPLRFRLCHISGGGGGIGHIKLYWSIIAQCLAWYLSRWWQSDNHTDGTWINTTWINNRTSCRTASYWCAANVSRSYMASGWLLENMMMQMVMTSRCNAANCERRTKPKRRNEKRSGNQFKEIALEKLILCSCRSLFEKFCFELT